MRGGAARGTSAGGWTVARLQRIGNWGRADEALGLRWEEVGLAALATLLDAPRPHAAGSYTPRHILALADDPALRREIHASGLPNPDAALLGTGPTDVGILQPVDFKWSLERAVLLQVSAATLERLLDAPLPALQGYLADTLAEAGMADAPVQRVDGFFFAPEHAENHAYLAGEANARAEHPLTPGDVLLWPVEPRDFFGPLPGWVLGCWLAEMDRSPRLLDTVEGAERYYRLGAGFAGALRLLHTPLFADAPAEVDARAELARLRTTRRLYSSADLAVHLERLMASRDALQRALREFEETLYPFRQFRAELAAGRLPKAPEGDEAPGPRERYRRARAAIGARVRAEGRKLLSGGQTEAGALAQLKTRSAELTKMARLLARQALADDA